jgi:hypothetical protein
MNFENVNVYTDLKREQSVSVNIKEQLAELIYQKGTGIQAHALALKIYNSTEDTEFTKNEKDLLLKYVNTFCAPMIIDAITTLVENN